MVQEETARLSPEPEEVLQMDVTVLSLADKAVLGELKHETRIREREQKKLMSVLFCCCAIVLDFCSVFAS